MLVDIGSRVGERLTVEAVSNIRSSAVVGRNDREEEPLTIPADEVDDVGDTIMGIVGSIGEMVSEVVVRHLY